MATIETNNITLSQSWGASFGEYSIGGTTVDFQDLMVRIAENRAVAVEGEVAPLSTRIQNRNKELDILGSLLAIFTRAQANFKSDASGTDTTYISGITPDMVELGCEAYRRQGGTPSTDMSFWNDNWQKRSVEGMLKSIKCMIDSRNNESQKDMTRLQSLVDRRDESYSTATTLMNAISDTRSNLIRNL